MYTKEYSGIHSAFCGCAIAAGTGMACGLVYLRGGSVKDMTGTIQNMTSSITGMTDNSRFELYGARYTVLAAGHMKKVCDFHCDLVGRCCESVENLLRLDANILRK